MALFCRHELKRAGDVGSNLNDSEADFQAREDKLVERIRQEYEERFSALEARYDERILKIDEEVIKFDKRFHTMIMLLLKVFDLRSKTAILETRGENLQSQFNGLRKSLTKMIARELKTGEILKNVTQAAVALETDKNLIQRYVWSRSALPFTKLKNTPLQSKKRCI